MKRNCNGCRALGRYGCDLKKKTEITTYTGNGHINPRKPLEECYKPKTYSEYFRLLNL